MKISKKYQLINSYFKVARTNYRLPGTILEIAEYLNKHVELPFAYNGDNWVYDAFCEKQKRSGVYNSQFLTPDATVDRMMHFAGRHFNGKYVLEPCCGTGQITKQLIEGNFNVTAFDCDFDMVKLCEILYPKVTVFQSDFKEVSLSASQIIANPPYEVPELTDFLEWSLKVLDYGGVSILLLPKGFIDKDKPKRLVDILGKFAVLEREDMREEFARTKTSAEIVVLKKL